MMTLAVAMMSMMLAIMTVPMMTMELRLCNLIQEIATKAKKAKKEKKDSSQVGNAYDCHVDNGDKDDMTTRMRMMHQTIAPNVAMAWHGSIAWHVLPHGVMWYSMAWLYGMACPMARSTVSNAQVEKDEEAKLEEAAEVQVPMASAKAELDRERNGAMSQVTTMAKVVAMVMVW